MAKYGDIIKKVLGLDSAKEYDITITETGDSTAEQQKAEPAKPEVTKPVETPPASEATKPPESSDSSQELKKALETIEQLKQVNYELLTGKSVQEPNLTDEQIIANLCGIDTTKGD